MTQVIKVPSPNGTKTHLPAIDLTKVKAATPQKEESNGSQEQPLDERLHRLNQLFELQGKFNRLQASKQKLNEFKLNQKSENISLTIEDNSNRNIDFETKNSAVIAEVLECVRQTIDKKIKEMEPLLKW